MCNVLSLESDIGGCYLSPLRKCCGFSLMNNTGVVIAGETLNVGSIEVRISYYTAGQGMYIYHTGNI